MYSVLIAEDEPVAMEHLQTLIEQYCPDYFVAATANNGQEALKLLDKEHYDLVITDIKMPVVDGLELAKTVHVRYPLSSVLIVSGYQEFEFARKAMNAGVFDYLLKPISPTSMKGAMERVSGRLAKVRKREQEVIIQRLANGAEMDIETVEHVFAGPFYHIALIRNNALPSRFSMSPPVELFSLENEKMILYGRDESESLCLVDSAVLSFNHFLDQVKNSLDTPISGYQTVVAYPQAIVPSLFPEAIRTLYHLLAERMVLGVSQIIYVGTKPKEMQPVPPGVTDTKMLEIYLNNGDIHGFKNELFEKLAKMETHRVSILGMENAIKQILLQLQENIKVFQNSDNMMLMVEQAFAGASYGAGAGCADGQINEDIISINRAQQKIDSESFFRRLMLYTEAHLTKHLTLQELSAHFGISQAYMSRLFRKYTNESYSEYVTRIRIEKACELLKHNPKLLIREVAAMVGYDSPFYFSRLFSSIVGLSPSKYIETISPARKNV